MNGRWFKVIAFILVAFMLASVSEVMLDPGLGKPDESRRTKHPAGFSMIPPQGWGASVFYPTAPGGDNWMRISPERSTGMQPSMGITRSGKPFEPPPDAVDYTFQGKPAFKFTHQGRTSYTWRIDFVRDGVPYAITVTYPVETKIEGGELWPFIESFKIEPVFDLTSTSTLPTTKPAVATTLP